MPRKKTSPTRSRSAGGTAGPASGVQIAAVGGTGGVECPRHVSQVHGAARGAPHPGPAASPAPRDSQSHISQPTATAHRYGGTQAAGSVAVTPSSVRSCAEIAGRALNR